MRSSVIYGDIISEYRQRCEGKPALVFCVSVKAARDMADKFKAAGFIAHSVDGMMAEDERKNRLEGLGNGSVQVITSCDIISEGMDVPSVAAIFAARPTDSKGLWMQQVGRSLRTAPGKTSVVICDHAGNTLRHGLPLEYIDWDEYFDAPPDIQYERKDRNKEGVKVCQNCLAVSPSKAHSCEVCGTAFPIGEGRKVDHRSGEMQAFSVEAAKRNENTHSNRACRCIQAH